MILIAGPCVIEGGEHCRGMAGALKEVIGWHADIDWYFKASFDKANRTSLGSFRGPGVAEGIGILEDIKSEFGIKVTTDFHECWQLSYADAVDVIQIPAFLCRQTDLLVAAGDTGKVVNIKKGQFADVGTMLEAVKKVGCDRVWVTERGKSFGSQLVVDFVDVIDLKRAGCTVILDCTHSVPDSGYVFDFARMGLAVGVDGLFMEVHDNPVDAKCDGKKSVRLDDFEAFLSGF